MCFAGVHAKAKDQRLIDRSLHTQCWTSVWKFRCTSTARQCCHIVPHLAAMARHRHMCALCGSDTGEWNGRLKKCSACRRVTYCSRRCTFLPLCIICGTCTRKFNLPLCGFRACPCVGALLLKSGSFGLQCLPMRCKGVASWVGVRSDAGASERTGRRTGQPASRSRCTCGGATSAAAARRNCHRGQLWRQ